MLFTHEILNRVLAQQVYWNTEYMQTVFKHLLSINRNIIQTVSLTILRIAKFWHDINDLS